MNRIFVVAVAIITILIVIVIGSMQGMKAYQASQPPKNSSELVDRIISLQEEQQEVLAAAQRALAEQNGPIESQLISMLKRLNMTDRKKYEVVMRNYFPNAMMLPDPNPAPKSEPPSPIQPPVAPSVSAPAGAAQ